MKKSFVKLFCLLPTVCVTACFKLNQSYTFDDVSYKKIKFQEFIDYLLDGEFGHYCPDYITGHVEGKGKIEYYLHTGHGENFSADYEYSLNKEQGHYIGQYDIEVTNITFDNPNEDYDMSWIKGLGRSFINIFYPSYAYGESETETKFFIWKDDYGYSYPSNEKTLIEENGEYYSNRTGGKHLLHKQFIRELENGPTYYLGKNVFGNNRRLKLTTKYTDNKNNKHEDIKIISMIGIPKEEHLSVTVDGVKTTMDFEGKSDDSSYNDSH